MARIRSIKPEFWTSTQIMDCDPLTRLFFIGLWNFCDDHGRHPVSEKQLKALIFPGDDISASSVRRMIDELSKNGLISIYIVDNKEYLVVTGWVHQKIDRRQDARYPAPAAGVAKPLVEDSSNGIDGKEGKGRDRISTVSSNEETGAKSAEIVLLKPVEPDADLFDRGKQVLGKSAGGQIAKLKGLYGGDVTRIPYRQRNDRWSFPLDG